MKQRWTFRAYPTPDHTEQLARSFGCVRSVWNWALHLRSEAYTTHHERIGYAEPGRRLTQLKRAPETAWLQEVSCVPLQQALRDLQTAFVHFFDKRAAYPQFKKKSRRPSAEYTTRGFSFDPATKSLTIAKLGTLKIRWSGDVIPMPSSLRIMKTTTGKYFVSLVVSTDPIPWPKSGDAVGLDFGITHLATLNTGETIDTPRHAEQQQRRQALLQRRLAKKQTGSRRREAAKHRGAVLHERIRNARRDTLHRLTTKLVKRFDVMYLEDLTIRGRGQNHSLARVLSDAAIGTALRFLEATTVRYGKTVVKIDRFFPSSKQCSTCRYVVGELRLNVRFWSCPCCGSSHDRDVNAAKNILAAGQAVAAHGAGRRPRRVPRRGTRRRSATHLDSCTC